MMIPAGKFVVSLILRIAQGYIAAKFFPVRKTGYRRGITVPTLVGIERELRKGARRAARTLALAEAVVSRQAQDACDAFSRIRPRVEDRLAAIQGGSSERFLGERRLAELALRDAERADAANTILSFARRRDRLRYLCGGFERETVIAETIRWGGVYGERKQFHRMSAQVRNKARQRREKTAPRVQPTAGL
jgi:hypothetical protein